MNPLDFPLLADENIHPDVVSYLRQQGYDIRSVVEEGLVGQSDPTVLRTAYAGGRVVLTHDSDFGTLVITQDEPFIGIVYLRPGHIRAEFTTQTLQTIVAQPLNVRPPFIVVAEQKEQVVQIRTRQLWLKSSVLQYNALSLDKAASLHVALAIPAVELIQVPWNNRDVETLLVWDWYGAWLDRVVQWRRRQRAFRC